MLCHIMHLVSKFGHPLLVTVCVLPAKPCILLQAANIIATLDKAAAEARLAKYETAETGKAGVLEPLIDTSAYQIAASTWSCLEELNKVTVSSLMPECQAASSSSA